MTEFQFDKLFAWIFYSVSLWMFSRFWHENMAKKEQPVQIENIVPMSVSAERLKTEQLINENRILKNENEQLKTELEQWKKIGRRENENLKAMKIQNGILLEALNKANKQRESEEADIEKPETTTDEFETMVQVMKGSPNQKDLYHQLMDRIDGSKQRVEEALNGTEEADCVNADKVDLSNFDINKFV